jgi:myo-inositol-1(or 4)-monophosphatase
MSPELFLACNTAVSAGQILLLEYEKGSRINSDVDKDIKLAADKLSEQSIIACLKKCSPYPILSEEAGADPNWNTQDRHWVVDPLDGTLNFSRRLPLCCVSIALWEKDRPILGVVHEFLNNRTYYGASGEGAWCNGTPLRVSATPIPSKAVLATGFPSQRDYGTDSLLKFTNRVAAFKKLRLLGSAALSLAFLAAGTLDAYCEEDIWFWDVAAGLALVQAAGGSFTMRTGTRPFQLDVFASNGLVNLSNSI